MQVVAVARDRGDDHVVPREVDKHFVHFVLLEGKLDVCV